MFATWVLMLAVSAVPAAASSPVAAMRFDAESSEWTAQIDGGAHHPYHLTIRCVRNCSAAREYSEDVNPPLGLFRASDRDPILYSPSASAVAYVVSAYAITDLGVSRILMAWSRGRPDFFADEQGSSMIRTYERPVDSSGRELSTVPQPVLWRYERGSFVRVAGGR